jgi:hypothetical protein
MRKFESGPALIPVELQPLVDEHFLETQARWQDKRAEDVVPPHELLTVNFTGSNGDENVRIGLFNPIKEADGSVIVVSFPFQQGLGDTDPKAPVDTDPKAPVDTKPKAPVGTKPKAPVDTDPKAPVDTKPKAPVGTMLARARFMQEAIAPNSIILMLANDHKGPNQSFVLSSEDKKRMKEDASLAAIAEKYVLALGKLKELGVLGAGSIALTGYSMGANMSIEMAGLDSDLEISVLNADEGPSRKDRTPKELQKDFLKSGGFGQQQKSMAESGFGTLMSPFTGANLAIDYAKFGFKTLTSVSKAVHSAMAGNTDEALIKATRRRPHMTIKIGRVVGSSLVYESPVLCGLEQEGRVRTRLYSGDAANGHTTGDNYPAHALMVKDGLQVIR